MPKSSKKRKEKAADFAKAKLKLGKGKKPASNEIDTSFKARSVALPNQTIRTEEHIAEHGVPTTRRRLTYDDLLIHLKHYSPSTRKDALQGLRELFSEYPALVVPNLGSLLGAIAKLIADDDHSVRKVLITFLEWILNQVPINTLPPHTPPLLLFAAAALAHITVAIRDDAVRVVGVLLDRIPRIVVLGSGLRERDEGPGARILEGLMATLGAGESKGVNNMSLADATKLSLLGTLSVFLQNALLDLPAFTDPRNRALQTWYFRSAFPSASAYDSFVSTLAPRDHSELDRPTLGKLDLASGLIGCDLDTMQVDNLGFDQTGPVLEDNVLNTLASRLQPVLTATFLDNAPHLRLESFSISAEMVVKVVELAKLLYGTIIRDGTPNQENFANLDDLLGHMTPYFPFEVAVGTGVGETANIKTREATQNLSVAYCELVSLLVSRTSQQGSRVPTQSNKRKPHSGNATERRVHEVAIYVVKCLRGELGSVSILGSELSSTTYTALLPTLWALRDEPEIIPAIFKHAAATSGRSKVIRRAAAEFVGRIVLIHSDPRRTISVRLARESIVEWALSLPRAAWEFGEKDSRGCEIVLLTMLIMNQRKDFDNATLAALRQRLVPFFMIDHATRGSIGGPWTRLPARTQKIALDLVSSLSPRGVEAATLLGDAVERAATGGHMLQYWMSIRPIS